MARDVSKMTVYLDAADYRRPKALARAQERPAGRRRERAEELLAGMGRR
jgi:hypothetical protein